jgi:hypothetical protein
VVTNEDWAWFAGLFEGEGTIGFTGANTVRLAIKMTDRDVLERAQRVAGGKVRRSPRKNIPAHWKPIWDWYIDRSDLVGPVLEKIEPYLLARRRGRLEEAQQRLSNVRRDGYCKHGHKLDEGHLYIGPKGERRCKICSNERARQWHIDHKEDRNAKQLARYYAAKT